MTRHILLCALAIALFATKILLDLFGGHSPVDLIALGLAVGWGSLI